MLHSTPFLRPNEGVKMLTEQEVSDLTRISTSTLQKHRFLGKGIPYFKVGRSVRYALEDVITFMDSCRVNFIHP